MCIYIYFNKMFRHILANQCKKQVFHQKKTIQNFGKSHFLFHCFGAVFLGATRFYQPRSRDFPVLRGFGATGALRTVGTLGPSSRRRIAWVRVQHTDHQILGVHLVLLQSDRYAS